MTEAEARELAALAALWRDRDEARLGAVAAAEARLAAQRRSLRQEAARHAAEPGLPVARLAGAEWRWSIWAEARHAALDAEGQWLATARAAAVAALRRSFGQVEAAETLAVEARATRQRRDERQEG